mmetsp:Transcript_24903/g.73644  ORF Transcript_24903/g.73644 Transcript_24903/m.73644 type:complete len:217 (+) Transcript_24903:122-772(+)
MLCRPLSHSAGTVPVSTLPPSSNCVRPVSADQPTGSVPAAPLLLSRSRASADSSLHSAGSVPVSALPLSSRLVSDVTWPSSDGSVPSRPAKLTSNDTGSPTLQATPLHTGAQGSVPSVQPLLRPDVDHAAADTLARSAYSESAAAGGDGGGCGGDGGGDGGEGHAVPMLVPLVDTSPGDDSPLGSWPHSSELPSSSMRVRLAIAVHCAGTLSTSAL